MTILKMKDGSIKQTNGMVDALNKLSPDVDVIITKFKDLYYEFNKSLDNKGEFVAGGVMILKSKITEPQYKKYYDLLVETHML